MKTKEQIQQRRNEILNEIELLEETESEYTYTSFNTEMRVLLTEKRALKWVLNA